MRPYQIQPPRGTGPFFAYRRRQERTLRFVWHYHQEYELTLIHRGAGLRHVGDHVEEYGPGDLVLVGPRLPHTWSCEAGPVPHDCVVIHFSPALFSAAEADDAGLVPLRGLLTAASRGLRIEGATRAAVARRMLAMQTSTPLGRLAALCRILERLAASRERRALASAGFALAEGSLDPVDRALRLVHRDFSRALPLAEVAATAGMSETTFTRAFRRATGRSLVAYLRELRVRRACTLLLDRNRAVAEVAGVAGFPSLANFNRRFRQVMGTTPTAFRRRARSGIQVHRVTGTYR